MYDQFNFKPIDNSGSVNDLRNAPWETQAHQQFVHSQDGQQPSTAARDSEAQPPHLDYLFEHLGAQQLTYIEPHVFEPEPPARVGDPLRPSPPITQHTSWAADSPVDFQAEENAQSVSKLRTPEGGKTLYHDDAWSGGTRRLSGPSHAPAPGEQYIDDGRQNQYSSAPLSHGRQKYHSAAEGADTTAPGGQFQLHQSPLPPPGAPSSAYADPDAPYPVHAAGQPRLPAPSPHPNVVNGVYQASLFYEQPPPVAPQGHSQLLHAAAGPQTPPPSYTGQYNPVDIQGQTAIPAPAQQFFLPVEHQQQEISAPAQKLYGADGVYQQSSLVPKQSLSAAQHVPSQVYDTAPQNAWSPTNAAHPAAPDDRSRLYQPQTLPVSPSSFVAQQFHGTRGSQQQDFPADGQSRPGLLADQSQQYNSLVSVSTSSPADADQGVYNPADVPGQSHSPVCSQQPCAAAGVQQSRFSAPGPSHPAALDNQFWPHPSLPSASVSASSHTATYTPTHGTGQSHLPARSQRSNVGDRHQQPYPDSYQRFSAHQLLRPAALRGYPQIHESPPPPSAPSSSRVAQEPYHHHEIYRDWPSHMPPPAQDPPAPTSSVPHGVPGSSAVPQSLQVPGGQSLPIPAHHSPPRTQPLRSPVDFAHGMSNEAARHGCLRLQKTNGTFCCPIARCGKLYKTRQTLSRHLSTTAVQCNFCQQWIVRGYEYFTLKRHLHTINCKAIWEPLISGIDRAATPGFAGLPWALFEPAAESAPLGGPYL
ncbi:hypothetical protein AURDEDRAFT_152108 [Auricularia subglabra TFB-10046 SS5]|uniref:Uncharacterized protein n=1 Tax=Auricularia subglabra (strain TFB-10046 / SS5) TaxID=717982 RepID=J0WXW8_AURST|nr:hypothetical protein AURDEDRAFT_152108 [Auricularia subglabra TFB-10046 SS5]